MKILSLQDIDDALAGAEILGCGGGGEIEWGRNLIISAHSAGRIFRLLEEEELKDDHLLCIIGFAGGGISDKVKEKLAPRLKNIAENDKFQKPLLRAAKELSLYLGKEIDGFLPTETGAGNFAAPMYASAMLDKYIIDGDACGRAKPEIAISTTHIAGLSVSPLSIVSPLGDVLILKETADDYRAEDICRYNAVISGGTCAVCRCPATGSSYRKAFIPGTISRCIKLGKAIRESVGRGLKPAKIFLEVIEDSKIIFRGKIKEWTRKKDEGFMWGDILIEGLEKYKKNKLLVWYKNEFLISWLNEKPFVTCPDLICMIDSETGKGLSNWLADMSVYDNRDVTVIGVKSHSLWKSEKGLEIFGPDHFGFDMNYMNFSEKD